jgi:hypothetical protein
MGRNGLAASHMDVTSVVHHSLWLCICWR